MSFVFLLLLLLLLLQLQLLLLRLLWLYSRRLDRMILFVANHAIRASHKEPIILKVCLWQGPRAVIYARITACAVLPVDVQQLPYVQVIVGRHRARLVDGIVGRHIARLFDGI